MKHYAGLDISLNETAICLIDQEGAVIKETSVPTNPDAINLFLTRRNIQIHRVGFETGNLSSWIYEGLAEKGWPVVCMEAHHASTLLKAQKVKTDRNDARGLAQIVRSGWYKPVHIKTRQSQRLRLLLNNRCTLLMKRKDIDNQIRGSLKVFGMKMGKVSAGHYEQRVRELLADEDELLSYVAPLLKIRRNIIEQIAIMHQMVMDIAKHDDVCRRLMTIPGIGVITSLAFKATIDQPERFSKSQCVGAHLGLTPKKYASGEIDYNGGITKYGDAMMRSYLYEAAQVLMRRTSKKNRIKDWGHKIAKRSSAKKAHVAVARKLAVVMHQIWVQGTEYQDDLEPRSA